jgi:uncharacterized membrane protein (UPF0127 family)
MYQIKIRKNEMKFTILVISVMFLFTGCAVQSVDNTDKPASEELVEPKEPVEPIEPAQGVVQEIPAVKIPEIPGVKMAVVPDVPAKTDSPIKNDTSINQVVEAACGQCQFRMTEKSGCDLAVKIDGKSYFVDGTTIHDHGDAHADDGFCRAIRQAEVKGNIIDGRFKAKSFTLVK